MPVAVQLGRHIVQFAEHVARSSLAAIAALVHALTGGYYLIRRLAQTPREPPAFLPDPEELQ
jgi:hypothetical protein